MRPRRLGIAAAPIALMGLLLCGCADERMASTYKETAVLAEAPSPGLAKPVNGVVAADKPAAPGSEGQEPSKAPAAVRKIVYNAQISMVAENLAKVSQAVNDLVKAAGGYISDTDESNDTGTQRRATWRVRIPVEGFDGFVKNVGRLGELQQSKIDSQDVTEEYVDLEARIKNKTEEEKRLLKHLADSTGKLDDILAVEKELTRVRGEVERIEGRLRYLGNVSALSTVTITAVEIKNYVPPAAPTFATQVSRRFTESWSNALGFGKGIVFVVVAVIPWIPFLALPTIVVVWLLIKIWKYRNVAI